MLGGVLMAKMNSEGIVTSVFVSEKYNKCCLKVIFPQESTSKHIGSEPESCWFDDLSVFEKIKSYESDVLYQKTKIDFEYITYFSKDGKKLSLKINAIYVNGKNILA